MLIARHASDLDSAVADITAEGGSAAWHQADVGDPAMPNGAWTRPSSARRTRHTCQRRRHQPDPGPAGRRGPRPGHENGRSQSGRTAGLDGHGMARLPRGIEAAA